MVDAQASHFALTREELIGIHTSRSETRLTEGIIPLLANDISAGVGHDRCRAQVVFENVMQCAVNMLGTCNGIVCHGAHVLFNFLACLCYSMNLSFNHSLSGLFECLTISLILFEKYWCVASLRKNQINEPTNVINPIGIAKQSNPSIETKDHVFSTFGLDR